MKNYVFQAIMKARDTLTLSTSNFTSKITLTHSIHITKILIKIIPLKNVNYTTSIKLTIQNYIQVRKVFLKINNSD